MATLASAITTNLASLLSSPTLIDLGRQRSATTSENTAATAAYAASAAVLVKAKLGLSIDSTDVMAVELGTIYAFSLAAVVYSLALTDAGVAFIKDIRKQLDDEAKSRRQAGYSPVKATQDFTDIDLRYPVKQWDESTDADD